MTSPVGLAERMRRFGAIAATAVLVAACGTSNASPGAPGGSGRPQQSPTVGNLPDLGLRNVTTQTANARGARIGPEGGTVSATADDGTTYSLVISAGAIEKPTQVALYPVSSVAGLPQGSKLAAGVQFVPDGLVLDAPATLTITLKAAADLATEHGLAWNGDGVDVRQYPAGIAGTTVTIPVDHFSGAGIGNPPLVSINTCSTQSEMDQAIADAVHAAATNAPGARDLFTRTLKLCYANFVRDALFLAETLTGPDDLEQAAAARIAYDTWLGGSTFWAAGFFPGFTVSPEVADSRPLAVLFLRNWFDTSNSRCVADAGQPLAGVIDANVAVAMPHEFAPRWGIDSRANKLDYETLLTDVCVHVVIDPSRGFSGSKPGDSGTVTVPVGYAVNGNPVLHDLPIHVKLTKTGAPPPFAEGDAPADGRYTAPYAWPATDNPLKIDVLASFVDYPVLAVFDRITKHPGSKMALVVRNASNETGIVVMDEDGTHLRGVTSGPADSWPSWSPDGTQVVFARQTVGGGTSTTSIQVVNADGTGLKALTSGPFDTGPVWAPDGSRIAFVRTHPSSGTTLALMNPDGTNAVDTGVKVFGAKLSWSPDSSQIVYSNYDPDGSGTVRLFVWTVGGGGSTKLATPACQPWGAVAPEWSSTGTIGFFCETHGNPDGNLWIATMSATGGSYKAITGNLYGKVIGGPTWSPDGTKFARVESGAIVVADAGGGGASTNLGVTTGGTIVGLDWGP